MFDLLVDSLERVGAPDLAPVLLREVEEGQQVVTSSFYHRHSGGALLAQHLGDPLWTRARHPQEVHPAALQQQPWNIRLIAAVSPRSRADSKFDHGLGSD